MSDYKEKVQRNILRNNTVKAALLSAVVLCSAGVAKADLNINGATGLFLNPTAEVVQKGQPRIQANYYDFGTDYDDTLYGVYGAIAAGEKWEVSGGINRFDVGESQWSDWDRNGFALGTKYRLLNNQEKGLQVAIGAGYDRALLNNLHAYVAATKSFNRSSTRSGIVGTLGLRVDRFTDLRQDEPNEKFSKISAFAGVEVPLTRTGDLRLIGEIGSKNTDGTFGPHPKFPYAVGLRYSPQDKAYSLSAGMMRQGINTPHETQPRIFVQAGYTFGK